MKKKIFVIGIAILFFGGGFLPAINAKKINISSREIITNNTCQNRLKNIFNSGNSQNVEWSKTFGGKDDEIGNSVQKTTDGGYIIGGSSGVLLINRAAWLIKTDKNGNEEWNKTYNGKIDSECYSVQQTSDGGYIFTGSITNSGLFSDILLIKTDKNGTEEWNRTYGGQLYDIGYSVQQTTDGGYIITGAKDHIPLVTGDVWLIKTDVNGNKEWSKTFGGKYIDLGQSVQQTTDGGYILTGTQNLTPIPFIKSDICLIKINATGVEEWSKTFGGDLDNKGYSIQQTTDGGFIITGTKNYNTVSLLGDVCLIKTDIDGNEEWSKLFGGDGVEIGYSVQQTSDGGYIITGEEVPFDPSNPIADLLLIKTDSNGKQKWKKNYGEEGQDIGYSVQQTIDGGFIITGKTSSYGSGNSDVWLIKTKGEDHNETNIVIEISGISIGKVSAEIKNVGEIDLTNVDWSITVTGGIFGGIYIKKDGLIEKLNVGQISIISTLSSAAENGSRMPYKTR